MKRQMNELSFSFISGDRDIGVFFFSIGAKRLLGFVPSLITAVGTGIGDNANQSNGKSLGSTKKRNGLWV